jgi:hypothetical protein
MLIASLEGAALLPPEADMVGLEVSPEVSALASVA